MFPEAIKKEILRFAPRVTGYFKIVLDKPGPSVTPPLKIKIEYGHGMQENDIKTLEDEMVKAFKEVLRVTPQFMWVPPESIPRESRKTKLTEVLSL